jgi:branched-chain amino acid transport system substrate-binding protein
MEQLGLIGTKYMGGDGICTDKIVELSGTAKTLSNVVCAEGGSSIERMPGGIGWKARYDAKYPKQFQLYSPYAYDATMVLASAMQKAGSADPAVYLPALASIAHEGVTAKIAFERDGELKNPSMTIYVYEGGKKVPVK